ncbi:MAG: hypothetical protein AB7U85_06380 [Alphaproteobacteria bacterium]
MALKVTADFMENEKGEILLAIPASEGEPLEPTLSFNEDASVAELKRSKGQMIEIPNIHPDIRSKLLKTTKILVTEVGNNKINNGYYVTVTK